jgi:CHASE3 domain sensor protein
MKQFCKRFGFGLLILLVAAGISYVFVKRCYHLQLADKYDLFVDLLIVLAALLTLIGGALYWLISEKITDKAKAEAEKRAKEVLDELRIQETTVVEILSFQKWMEWKKERGERALEKSGEKKQPENQ